MSVRLRSALPRRQILFAKCVAAWRAARLRIEGAPTEGEAEAEVEVEVEVQAEPVKAWKSIDQPS